MSKSRRMSSEAEDSAVSAQADSHGGREPSGFFGNYPSLRKAILESAVIVLSILLAFGIDAWWEEQRESANSRESLEVVRRDLADALMQLEEFEQFSIDTAKASVAAARALSGAEPVAVQDRPEIEAHLLRSTARRTMRLPRAGYTDLLNTGNLAEVDNRALRDALVQFYEAADRSQEIVEKNSSLFTDEVLKDALIASGLFIPMPGQNAATPLQEQRNEFLVELIGAEFPQRPARLWQVSVDSIEMDRLIAALMQNARGGSTATIIVRNIQDRANELIRNIDDHLAE